MQQPNRHIVQKLVFDLHHAAEADGFALQQEAGRMAREKLTVALEELFDRFAGPDELLVIDELRVEVEDIPPHDFADVWLRRVLEAIEIQLSRRVQSAAGAHHQSWQQSMFILWTDFLDTGRLGWQAPNIREVEWQAAILAQLSSETRAVQMLGELLRRKPTARLRLIRQHPEAFLVQLFGAFTASRQSELPQLRAEIQAAAATGGESAPATTERGFNEFFWQEALHYFVTGPTSSHAYSFAEHLVRLIFTRTAAGATETPVAQLRRIVAEYPNRFPVLSAALGSGVESAVQAQRDTALPSRRLDSDLSTEKMRSSAPGNDVGRPGHPGEILPPPAVDDDAGKHLVTRPNALPQKPEEIPEEKPGEPAPLPTMPPEEPQPFQALQRSEVPDAAGGNYAGLSSQESAEESDKSVEESGEKISDRLARLAEQGNPPGPPEMSGTTPADWPEGAAFYVRNAGIVLLHPFFTAFFREMDLLVDSDFRDEAARQRAVHLIQYLATGSSMLPEYELLLPRFLCNVPFGIPLERFIALTEKEQTEGEELLRAAIRHWKVLQNTSPDGLREGFLQRDGKLEKRTAGWYITVEQRGIDVLLDRLPWSIGMIKLPWMTELLRVEWG